MKKIIISILFFVMGSFSIVSAEIGVNIGISGNIGLYEASGFEMEDGEKTSSKDQEGLFGMGSIFIEKKLNFLPGPLSRLTLGFDHVPHDIPTPAHSNDRRDCVDKVSDADGCASTANMVSNTASAELKNINTIYFNVDITNWLYVKAGYQEMDIITTETLQTGSKYGNTSIDGHVLGLGVQQVNDNGVFFRFSVENTSLDGAKITATATPNSVTLDDITGTSARFSVGKSF